MSRRSGITQTTKETLLSRQFGCCNNRPQSTDPSFQYINSSNELIKYRCPMWKSNGGLFDESGYDADHILEHAVGGSDDISNLQLICPCCHSFKTKLFTRQPMVDGQRGFFTSADRGVGRATMDELENVGTRGNKAPKLPKTESMDLGFGKSIPSELKYLRSIT